MILTLKISFGGKMMIWQLGVAWRNLWSLNGLGGISEVEGTRNGEGELE